MTTNGTIAGEYHTVVVVVVVVIVALRYPLVRGPSLVR